MNNEQVTVNPFNLKISNEDIDKIVDKAINEGILHWCFGARLKYAKTISNDGVLLLDGVDGNVYELAKGKLMFGLMQATPYLTECISGDTLDISTIDSDTADFIIQLSLFNEIVYE